ncbi:FAD-dependent monooxygenase [Nocardiopsis aegyptia]|uniref:2-polyprenyl-6-methoxyphenol hydroxylase-like FAD-dependent oxidoreductase n=1 Tax=Nocardiopsis aegyptia TaxID=220378 RepID=A0A7Z0JBM1_9ACTN|nr:FAD-dependent monooxygenase [Nocardiopsis aegyptia]NYJ35584.1 2-polyprenyl-6-methoxyphenol hydroxylase-like FAD-dependent oxidoreductase [Nocardiopsis aegyptia]
MDVLIVGGGPVGMLLGCELRQRGLSVRIVDAGRDSGPHSRANVVWPRNLELLDRVGATARLLERGHRLSGTSFYSSGRRIGTAYMSGLGDTPHPYAVMISQNETERVLAERLGELGTAVETGVRLVGVDSAGSGASGDRPAARLEHPDGRVEEVEPSWLVGADGAHSTVRSLLGIGYTGRQPELTFAITDAELTTGLSADLSHYCYSPRGAVVLGPMGGGVFRLAVNVAPDAHPERPGPEVFQRVLDERAGGGSTVERLRWSALFQVRCRLAETFRVGRCFLVGDAAHIISPAGGQGMNTGMQDAVNLAWRLGGVLGGELDDAVLDGYDTERRTVSHRVARSTAFMTRFGVVTTPVRTVVRDTAFRVADRTGALQRYMAPRLSQTDIGYEQEEAGGPLAAVRALGRRTVPVGGRLPAVFEGPADRPEPARWPVLDRDRYTLVLWHGRGTVSGDPALRRSRVRALTADRAAVVEPGRTVHPSVARALGTDPVAVVVRPDGHVHARVAPDDTGRLAGVLDALPLATVRSGR